jgi:hypothetical protein
VLLADYAREVAYAGLFASCEVSAYGPGRMRLGRINYRRVARIDSSIEIEEEPLSRPPLRPLRHEGASILYALRPGVGW